MADALRIQVDEARKRVESGLALLVCAYDSEEKYRANRLLGSIPFSELMDRLSSLPMDQEIILYCA